MIDHRDRIERLESVDQHPRLAGPLDDCLHAGPRQVTSGACQLTPSRTLVSVMPRSEPESRSDSPIKTRNGGGLTREAGPVPLNWTTEPVSRASGADDCDGVKPKPVRASPARCPGTRWPPGRSSDSTLVWPQAAADGDDEDQTTQDREGPDLPTDSPANLFRDVHSSS